MRPMSSCETLPKRMSSITGRTITYDAISTSAGRDQPKSAGLAESRVDLLLGIDELNGPLRLQRSERPRSRTRRHPARRIEDFLRRHQAVMTPRTMMNPQDDRRPHRSTLRPIAGAQASAKSANTTHLGAITLSNLPHDRLGISESDRRKVGSHRRQGGLETTCVGSGQGMAWVLERLR